MVRVWFRPRNRIEIFLLVVTISPQPFKLKRINKNEKDSTALYSFVF